MEEYGVNRSDRHRGLAIASVVLGSLSCFCCLGSGIGIIPAVIAIVFGVIAIVRGGVSSRKLSKIGLVTGIVGLLLNLVIIVLVASAINWDMLTLDRLATVQRIDPNNEEEMISWLQQFFKIDLSRLMQ